MLTLSVRSSYDKYWYGDHWSNQTPWYQIIVSTHSPLQARSSTLEKWAYSLVWFRTVCWNWRACIISLFSERVKTPSFTSGLLPVEGGAYRLAYSTYTVSKGMCSVRTRSVVQICVQYRIYSTKRSLHCSRYLDSSITWKTLMDLKLIELCCRM